MPWVSRRPPTLWQRMRRLRRTVLPAAGLLLIGLLVLVTRLQASGRDHPVRIAPPALEWELALGKTATPLAIEQMGGRSMDTAISTRVTEIGARLLRRSSAGSMPFEYQFIVLADARAFGLGLPGGPLLVSEGLLTRLTTDGEIAAVLARLAAEVVQRRLLLRLAESRQSNAEPLSELLGDANAAREADPAQLRRLAGLLLQDALLPVPVGDVGHASADALSARADAMAVRYLSQAGFDPRRLRDAYARLQDAEPWNTQHAPYADQERVIASELEDCYPAGVPEGLTQ